MNWLTVRHPVRAGVVCVVVAFGIVLAALAVPRATLVLRTHDYHATVANATGLQPGDTVNVAGVPSGTVSSLSVHGNTVDVTFRLARGVRLGDHSTADIKIVTLLGRRSLDVTPRGPGALEPGGHIPLARTTVPFTLDEISREGAATAEDVDLDRMRGMIDTLAEVTPRDPELVGDALTGISEVGAMITRNSERVQQVLDAARVTTRALADQQDVLVTLLGNADLVLATVNERRAVLTSLIADVEQLSTAARRFLVDNQVSNDAVLRQLHEVTATLRENETVLTDLLENFAPSVRYVTNATGNGNWLDLNSPSTLIGDNWLCKVQLVRGCR
ncbi:phospholipid/cholesterol/gamma-HCH transport system substrate-binding protein [Rhodococcus triatomae]|uniref:Phospholipid/cholesterol/gamma-HCH transport system substrate-binding protein n=1 Tax=Rhodococcus triatomae TaxID=300028 RepID=A0A1G7ZT03_9NOCA|nr:MCE family protein [Rhodococcus triatomae]SDH11808.1 phospholipid/cholesterol/gamma-HCH transport system substrate-binding protein [Rhodococcus triatomae]